MCFMDFMWTISDDFFPTRHHDFSLRVPEDLPKSSIPAGFPGPTPAGKAFAVKR